MVEFMAIGNGELDNNQTVNKNDVIVCEHCGKEHKIKAGKNEDGSDSDLFYYNCGMNIYFAAMGNKAILPLILKQQ